MLRGTKSELLTLAKATQKSGAGSWGSFFTEQDYEIIPDKEKPDDYIPEPTAMKFHASNARIRFLRGPVGCGKTFASCREMFNVASHIPAVKGVSRCNIVAIRNTYALLRDATKKTFMEAIPTGVGGIYRAANREWEGEYWLSDTHKVHLLVSFLAIEDDRSLSMLKGREYTAAFLNELSELRPETLGMLYSRLGRFPSDIPSEMQRGWAWADSNSFDTAHDLYDYFYNPQHRAQFAMTAELDNVEDGIATFDYPSALSVNAENIKNLPKGYYEGIVAANQNRPDWVKINVENEFGAVAKGLKCYPNFAKHIHAHRELKAQMDLPLFIGADFGKDAAIVVCQEVKPGYIRIVDALHETQHRPCVDSLADMYAVLAQRYPPEKYKWELGGYDPGGAAGNQANYETPEMIIQDQFKRFGVAPCSRATSNNPRIRIETVNAALGRMSNGVAGLEISSHLHWLVRAMSMYQWERLNSRADYDKYADKPAKNPESHIAEALQYALLRPGGMGHLQTKWNADKRMAEHKKRRSAVYVPRDVDFCGLV